MSKMAELDYDIQELFIEGLSANEIAKQLNVPVTFVLDAFKNMGVNDQLSEMA
jgi:hypothetical protein